MTFMDGLCHMIAVLMLGSLFFPNICELSPAKHDYDIRILKGKILMEEDKYEN